MSKRNIVIEPDPILRKKSTILEKVNDEIRNLLDDMLETMYAAPGIGLAAVQIGILKRIIVIDISKADEEKKPLFFINPEITFKSQKTSIHEEGCLSLPTQYAKVERPNSIEVQYKDENGRKVKKLFSGIEATCLQHEIDHLDGKLFVDHISKLKKNRIIKKLEKIKKTKSY